MTDPGYPTVVSVPHVIQGQPAPVAPSPAPPPPPVAPPPVDPSLEKISRFECGLMTKLSILIVTLRSRAAQLGALLEKLQMQMISLKEDLGGVEILTFEDEKQFSVGYKRNRLLDQAKGLYTCFVDDDDDVADDYLLQILTALKKNPGVDCVGFRGLMSVEGQGSNQVHYSLENSGQIESGGTYYRQPGHLTPIRKSCLSGIRFPEQNFGEDADFSVQLLRKKVLQTQAFIDKVLYHYRFNPHTSETHRNRGLNPVMGRDVSIFHIVILSAVADNLRGCLDSILKNEPTLPRNRIVVVDDGAKADCEKEYPGITWVQGQKPFIFARNANLGIKVCPNDVILLNDDARLETKYGFSSLAFASKSRDDIGICSAAIRGFVGNPNQKPWGIQAGLRKEPRNVAFVCVYIPKDVLIRVGLLDERFTGYGHEDNDYNHRVQLNNLFIMIYDGCVVEHNSTENKSTFRTNSQCQYWSEANKKIFQEKWPDLKMGPPPGQ